MTNAPFIAELTLAVEAVSGDDDAARALGRSHILLMRICQIAASPDLSSYQRSDAIAELSIEIESQIEDNRLVLWSGENALPFISAPTIDDIDEGQ